MLPPERFRGAPEGQGWRAGGGRGGEGEEEGRGVARYGATLAHNTCDAMQAEYVP